MESILFANGVLRPSMRLSYLDGLDPLELRRLRFDVEILHLALSHKVDRDMDTRLQQCWQFILRASKSDTQEWDWHFSNNQNVSDFVRSSSPKEVTVGTGLAWIMAEKTSKEQALPLVLAKAKVDRLSHPARARLLLLSLEFQQHIQPRLSKYCKQKLDKYVEAPRPSVLIPSDLHSRVSCLDPDEISLLRTIHFAGGTVPACFFGHAWTWNSSGERYLVDVHASAVLDDDSRREKAIRNLKAARLLIESSDCSDSVFLTSPETSCLFAGDPIASRQGRREAIAAVCKAYPRSPGLDPLGYSKHGNAMISVARMMVSYLDEIALTDEGLLEHIVDVCISASYFCTLHWKQLMLRTAARISGNWGQQKPLLHHRIFLRTLMVRRLSCTEDEPEAVYPDLPIVDRRSNAYFGEKILFQMQVVIDVGGLDMMQKLVYYHERLSPFLSSPSTQEFLVFVEAKFLLAKSYKFFGAFDKAASTFVELLEAYSEHPKSSPSKRFMACYAETLCEQGHVDKAIALLDAEVGLSLTESGARLKLALANAHLVKALAQFRRSFDIDNYSLDLANNYYTKYRDSYERYGVKTLSRTTKHNHFVVCTGIAMIQHMRATTFRSMESALSAWDIAHSAATNCWPPLGYSEMLVLYSKSELAYRLGSAQAGSFGETARSIYYRLGRQHYFTAHGTFWLDILDNLTERNGRRRMASDK